MARVGNCSSGSGRNDVNEALNMGFIVMYVAVWIFGPNSKALYTQAAVWTPRDLFGPLLCSDKSAETVGEGVVCAWC